LRLFHFSKSSNEKQSRNEGFKITAIEDLL
jgi:hypothetical protein